MESETKTTPEAKQSAKLVRESKRHLARTNLGKLRTLLAEQTRWQRKQTIAENKLIRVRRLIDALAAEMANASVATEWEGGAK